MKNNKSKILYVECGTTLQTEINTGIQRVVRKLTSELSIVGEEFNLSVVPVKFVDNGFYPTINIPIEVAYKSIIFKILKIIDQAFFARVNSDLLNKVKNFTKNLLNRTSNKKITKIQGDQRAILLLLDSSWYMSMWPYVDLFKAQGGIVCAVLYDLIPFSHPHTVENKTRIQHTQWWLKAHEHVDSVICISQSVRKEYLDWQQNRQHKNQLPPSKVGFFHLGSNFSNTDSVIKILIEKFSYFIMVGSLEPRKNHSIVIDAFENLWLNNIEANLVIVGNYGWKSEALIKRIENHEQFNIKLFLIRDASDRDLASLYSNAVALISASLAEGFGLPIIEAQHYGIPIICSDIPVFREVVGSEDVKFFNPIDLVSLMKAIKISYDESACNFKSFKKARMLSWRESAKQLCSSIINITK